MSAIVACPSCSARLKLPDNLLGGLVQCPQCATQFQGIAEPVAMGTVIEDPGVPASSTIPDPAPASGYRPDLDFSGYRRSIDLPFDLPSRGKALAAMILLGVWCALALFTIGIGVVQLSSLERVGGNTNVETQVAIYVVLFGGLVVMRIGIGVPFLMWMHAAHKNLSYFGVEGLSYSPGWAVGGFFVPILNLVRPCQVAQEIWRASDPDGSFRSCAIASRRSERWQGHFWWAFWLLLLVSSNVGGAMADDSRALTAGMARTLIITNNVSLGIGIAAGILAILMIKQVQDRQAEKLSIMQALEE